jgi:hypothetical protein
LFSQSISPQMVSSVSMLNSPFPIFLAPPTGYCNLTTSHGFLHRKRSYTPATSSSMTSGTTAYTAVITSLGYLPADGTAIVRNRVVTVMGMAPE